MTSDSTIHVRAGQTATVERVGPRDHCPVCGTDAPYGPARIVVEDDAQYDYVECRRCHHKWIVARVTLTGQPSRAGDRLDAAQQLALTSEFAAGATIFELANRYDVMIADVEAILRDGLTHRARYAGAAG